MIAPGTNRGLIGAPPLGGAVVTGPMVRSSGFRDTGAFYPRTRRFDLPSEPVRPRPERMPMFTHVGLPQTLLIAAVIFIFIIVTQRHRF